MMKFMRSLSKVSSARLHVRLELKQVSVSILLNEFGIVDVDFFVRIYAYQHGTNVRLQNKNTNHKLINNSLFRKFLIILVLKMVSIFELFTTRFNKNLNSSRHLELNHNMVGLI